MRTIVKKEIFNVIACLQKIIIKLFSIMGLKITRGDTGLLSIFNKNYLSGKSPYRWLQDMDIRTVIDIGANIGKFSFEIHKLLPAAKIYSFEPLKDCFKQMNINLKNIANFKSFNLALGNKQGKAIIYYNNFSPANKPLMKPCYFYSVHKS